MQVAQSRPFLPLVFVLLHTLGPDPAAPVSAGGTACTLPGCLHPGGFTATGWGLSPLCCPLFLLPPDTSSHALPCTAADRALSVSSLPAPLPTACQLQAPGGGRWGGCRRPAFSVSPLSQAWRTERGHSVISVPGHEVRPGPTGAVPGPGGPCTLTPTPPHLVCPLCPVLWLPQLLLPGPGPGLPPGRSPTGGCCFLPHLPFPLGTQVLLWLLPGAPPPCPTCSLSSGFNFLKVTSLHSTQRLTRPAAPTPAISGTAVQVRNQLGRQGAAGAGAAQVLS